MVGYVLSYFLTWISCQATNRHSRKLLVPATKQSACLLIFREIAATQKKNSVISLAACIQIADQVKAQTEIQIVLYGSPLGIACGLALCCT